MSRESAFWTLWGLYIVLTTKCNYDRICVTLLMPLDVLKTKLIVQNLVRFGDSPVMRLAGFFY